MRRLRSTTAIHVYVEIQRTTYVHDRKPAAGIYDTNRGKVRKRHYCMSGFEKATDGKGDVVQFDLSELPSEKQFKIG